MNTPITFEQLPQAMELLIDEVRELKIALLEKKEVSTPVDRWFDISELQNYLPDHPAKPTIYGWVSNRQIPHHKGKKKLRFLKSEIDVWLSGGKRKSECELELDAKIYLASKKSNSSFQR